MPGAAVLAQPWLSDDHGEATGGATRRRTIPVTPLARCVMALGAAAAQQTGSLNTLTSTTVMGCKHPITRLLTVSVCTPVLPQSVHPMWGRPPVPGLNATITFGTRG